MTDARAMLPGVEDATSFAAFAARLKVEVHENAAASGPFDAENFDLDRFLTSVQQWASLHEMRDTIVTDNPWRAAARVLLAGHYHE